jgi:CheY-like chemotaxis protein
MPLFPDLLPTLLITDDDPLFRETLRDVFESQGFQTVLAQDGLEAFEIVQQKPVHLALFDFNMPRLDGIKTICKVHQVKPYLPCILLSAALDECIRKQAEEAAAFSVLSKPCSRKQITSLVRQALEFSYSF